MKKQIVFAAFALALALGVTASATKLSHQPHIHKLTEPGGPPPVCPHNDPSCDLG